MSKFSQVFVSFSSAILFSLGLNAAQAAQTVYSGEVAAASNAFDGGVVAAGSQATLDTWLNPVWEFNTGQYTGTPDMPFVFNALNRDGYTVEKGLFPVGIPSRLTFLPVQLPDSEYNPFVFYSSLSGQAINFNPDTQSAGGPNIYNGHHPGIEYGLTFKFDQPINAFGLEYQVEAHNGFPEPASASFYFSLDGGPRQLLAGPTTPDTIDRASFLGILNAKQSFSTITFFTDGPRDSEGALMAFYNAYAGGTIRYASLGGASAVPELPVEWMLLGGLMLVFTRTKQQK